MENLKSTYSSLALFSDIDWDAVTKEFESLPPLLTFPEYLQEKAEAGDCPHYLFELAFYLFALEQVQGSSWESVAKGKITLNPTALFLNFEFDVVPMLEEAEEGNVEILERTHVLSLFKNAEGDIILQELSNDELDYLTLVEEGTATEEPSMNHLYELELIQK